MERGHLCSEDKKKIRHTYFLVYMYLEVLHPGMLIVVAYFQERSSTPWVPNYTAGSFG